MRRWNWIAGTMFLLGGDADGFVSIHPRRGMAGAVNAAIIGRPPGPVALDVRRLGDGSNPECAKVEWLTERDAV